MHLRAAGLAGRYQVRQPRGGRGEWRGAHRSQPAREGLCLHRRLSPERAMVLCVEPEVSLRRGVRAFLDTIDAAVPAELDVHLVLDNLSTHKAPTVRRWVAKRPRFHLHFTPTSSSWINMVERWFGLLTERQLRRGAHRSASRSRPPSSSTSRLRTRNRSHSSGRRAVSPAEVHASVDPSATGVGWADQVVSARRQARPPRGAPRGARRRGRRARPRR
jgi:transposase